MRSIRKESYIMAIILLVLGLGIGYAYISTTLNINGSSDFIQNTWDVYWDNVQVITGSVTGSQVTQAPTINQSDKTSLSLRVRLKEPGEYYEFTVDAKNDGSIDAMVESVVKKVNGSTTIPEYLRLETTYVGGDPIVQGHLLKANTTQKYKIKLEYRTDINPDLLPEESLSTPISIEINYVQATSNAIPVPVYVYTTVFPNIITLNQSINSGITQYSNPYDLINTTTYPYFIRHTMNENIVEKFDLGFAIDNTVYYLEYGDTYANLKQQLNSIFGQANCSESYQSYYNCTDGTIVVNIYLSESMNAGIMGEYFCNIYNNGNTALCWND